MNMSETKKDVFLSIIIPAFNEEKRLPCTLKSTLDFLESQSYNSEVIIVNDGSSDGTKQVVEAFNRDGFNLKYIEYFPNRGKGYAVRKGMLEAKGEFRLFMDADYAVPIEFLVTFLSMINHNYDIVIGSRGLRQSQIESHQPFLREIAAKTFGVIQRIILGLPILDTQCGFKLFTKEATEKIFPLTTFNCAYFDAELLYIAYKTKMQIGEIGVRWNHDGETRLPIGLKRTADIIHKLLRIKKITKIYF